MWEKWDYSKKKKIKAKEELVTDIVNEKIDKASSENKNIISSDTNLNKDRRNSLKHKLERLGYVVEFKFFDIDFDKAVKWDLYRADSVGKDVLYEQYMRYHEDKKIVQDESLPECIIVDIDGTCAHMINRGPFNLDKVDQDIPDEEVFHIIKDNWVRGRQIIFLSGRDSCCYAKTKYWLIKNLIKYVDRRIISHHINSYELYMRKKGDNRKDVIIKEELFNEHIRDKYNVKLVLDDRAQVCIGVWHKLGLKLLQCGNAYINF